MKWKTKCLKQLSLLNQAPSLKDQKLRRMFIMNNTASRDLTYLEAIRETIIQVMDQDEDVYLFGEDVAEYGGAFGVSVGMLEKFGKNRIINTPISEDAIVGLATGSALTGMRPVSYTHLRAHETDSYLVCRLLLEKKK